MDNTRASMSSLEGLKRNHSALLEVAEDLQSRIDSQATELATTIFSIPTQFPAVAMMYIPSEAAWKLGVVTQMKMFKGNWYLTFITTGFKNQHPYRQFLFADFTEEVVKTSMQWPSDTDQLKSIIVEDFNTHLERFTSSASVWHTCIFHPTNSGDPMDTRNTKQSQAREHEPGKIYRTYRDIVSLFTK